MTSSAFIDNIFPANSVTGGLATLALAVAIGIAFGNLRFKGVRLGVAAVLFSAMLFAQFGLTIDPHVLEYFRDFALVLFVYTLGLQMGPGFFSSLRAEGLRLNVLAVLVVTLGAVMTGLIVHFAHLPRELASGLYTGGFATTPALAAGEEALKSVLTSKGPDAVQTALSQTDLAYSVAYPFGLTGPILLVILFRVLFKVKISDELKLLAESERVRRPQRAVVDVEVTNPAVAGRTLRHQCFLQSKGVLLARLLRGEEQSVPNANTTIALGDIYRAVGPQTALDELVALMGQKSAVNLAEQSGHVQRADLVVTHGAVLGKSLQDLDLINRFGVTVARVQRAGVDLSPGASLTFHFGGGTDAGGNRPFTAWKHRIDRLVHAARRQSDPPGFWDGGVPGVRWISVGEQFLPQPDERRITAGGLGNDHHHCADDAGGIVRAPRAEDEFRYPERSHFRGDDQFAHAAVCKRNHRLRRPRGGICGRVSAVHAGAGLLLAVTGDDTDATFIAVRVSRQNRQDPV
jgi:AspT/YidE/YbjL antiporter-like protein